LRGSILMLLFLLPLAGFSGEGFDRLYVFGDSLSDTGNLASVQGELPPPFYMNRISNGPVAVEVLARRLGLDAEASRHLLGPASGTNYAVAGARAGGDSLIDLGAQVQAFLLNHAGAAPAGALYVVFIGGNDVRDARDAGDHHEAGRILRRAAHAVGDALAALNAAGAQSFLVMNAPDLGNIPETRLLALATGDEGLIKRATRYSRRFNRLLGHGVREFGRSTGAAAVVYDVFGFLNDLRDNAAGLGFANKDDACFSTVSFTFHPDCGFGAFFDRFVFFDEIHPTAHTHERAGRSMYALVPVPGPVRVTAAH